MGLIAKRAGLAVALTIAAAGLALSPLAGLVRRFRSIPPETLLPSGDWPAPVLAPDQTPEGPVLVGIQHRVRPGLEDDRRLPCRKRRTAADAPRDLLAGLARRERPAGARGSSSSLPGTTTSPERARGQHEQAIWSTSAKADRPGQRRRRHPLAGRQLAQVDRALPRSRRDCRSDLSGPGRELRGPGQERPRPEENAHDKLVELRLFGADGICTGARNGAGVNSHGNTASRTLLVPNFLRNCSHVTSIVQQLSSQQA